MLHRVEGHEYIWPLAQILDCMGYTRGEDEAIDLTFRDLHVADIGAVTCSNQCRSPYGDGFLPRNPMERRNESGPDGKNGGRYGRI